MRPTIDLKAVNVLAVILVLWALGMDAQTLATGKQHRASGGQQSEPGQAPRHPLGAGRGH